MFFIFSLCCLMQFLLLLIYLSGSILCSSPGQLIALMSQVTISLVGLSFVFTGLLILQPSAEVIYIYSTRSMYA